MTKWNRIARVPLWTCLIYLGAGVTAWAETTAEEARPGASPKVIACMTACELTQMACLQGPNGVPPERRTIKEINAFRACNLTEERCDHRCRRSK
jgi:hypothetical protein